MKPEVVSGILDSVYAAGTSPELWPAALEQLGQVFHCSCVSLVNKDLKTSAATAFAWGIDAAGERSYLDYWLPRNVFHLRTRVWRPGEVQTDRTILPKHELLRSEYYNGFLKPFEMHAMMRVALSVDDGRLHLLSLARSAMAGEYEATDVETLRPLVRHLQRAAAVTRHMNDAQGALRGFSDLLEQSTTGILLLSISGSVIFANRAARAMLANSPVLELHSSRLTARKPGDAAILQRLIAGATGALRDIAAARGGAFRLGAADAKLTVVVGPLAGRASGPAVPAAFVLLTDPDRGLSRPAWMLRNLYALTAAEIAMAERLMNGDTPQQAAAALGIKVSTARFHLGALFRKTDTRRQAELVRLLLSLPDT